MLTDTAIRKAKPADQAYKLRDGRGLYLLIQPNGSRWWRWDYRRPVTGKRNTLSLGTYPDVALVDARERHQQARKLLATGVDPGEHRKAHKAAHAESHANSFEVLGREWLTLKEKGWTQSHHEKQVGRLENHAFPYIGTTPITDVDIPALRAIIRRIEQAGHNEQLHRVMACISNVFDYAIATERAERNPARDLRAAMPARRRRHFATITDPAAIGGLLRAIDGYGYGGRVHVATCAALKLAPITFVRPGELRGARWEEFEFDHPTGSRWVIPPTRRKLLKAAKDDPTTPPHIVPLASQAVAILRELQPLTGHREHVFPGVRDPKRCMSNNTVNGALRNLGYTGQEIVGHGFRHMASTLLNEMGYDPDLIEVQLSHKGTGVRAIYNQARYMPGRHQMMQAWADYLDSLREGTTNVVPFKLKTA